MAGDNTQSSKSNPAGELEHYTGRLSHPAEVPDAGAQQTDVAQSVWGDNAAMAYFRLMYAGQSGSGTSGGLDRGPISDIDLPSGWRQRESSFGSIGLSSNETFSPPGDNGTTIGIYSNGLRAGSESAKAFLDLLKNKPAEDGPQRLTADEIRSLSEIMGRYQAGDNQYTNSGKYRPPAFEITSAYTMQLNGKTVLAVEGNFKDGNKTDAQGRAVTRQYKGIFADTDGTGSRVEQVFLSTAPGTLHQHVREFNETLDSIKWKS